MRSAGATSIFAGVPEGNRAGFWAGNGGSLGYIDLDERLAIGYTPNRWITGRHETDRNRRIVEAVYASLES